MVVEVPSTGKALCEVADAPRRRPRGPNLLLLIAHLRHKAQGHLLALSSSVSSERPDLRQ